MWPGVDRTDPMPGLSVNVGEAGGRAGAQGIFAKMSKKSNLGSFSSSTKLVNIRQPWVKVTRGQLLTRSFFTCGTGYAYHESYTLQVHPVHSARVSPPYLFHGHQVDSRATCREERAAVSQHDVCGTALRSVDKVFCSAAIWFCRAFCPSKE